jgi:hypothetical protein
MCHWSDGDMWRCPDMTNAMYLETRHKVAESKFWEGSHDVTNHNLTVEQKCGRTLLILLKEQTRKILQVHAQWWGPLPLPQPATAPNEHPTVKAAADFVIALSKGYKSCEIEDIPALKQVRDEELKKIGIKPKGGVNQRVRERVVEKPMAKVDETPVQASASPQSVRKRPVASVAALEPKKKTTAVDMTQDSKPRGRKSPAVTQGGATESLLTFCKGGAKRKGDDAEHTPLSALSTAVGLSASQSTVGSTSPTDSFIQEVEKELMDIAVTEHDTSANSYQGTFRSWRGRVGRSLWIGTRVVSTTCTRIQPSFAILVVQDW